MKQITLLQMIEECEYERGDKSNYSKRNWDANRKKESSEEDHRPWL